jgi:hypothetical protein
MCTGTGNVLLDVSKAHDMDSEYLEQEDKASEDNDALMEALTVEDLELSSTGKFKPGDRGILSKDWERFPWARNGHLAPGEIGIIQMKHSSSYFLVRCWNQVLDYYEEASLVRVESTSICLLENEWSVLTVNVDIEGQKLHVFLDGALFTSYSDQIFESLHLLSAETPIHILSSAGTHTKKRLASVMLDVKFVCLDLEILDITRILELHVPMGVWRCACLRYNGPGFDYCQSCMAPKQRSGTSPLEVCFCTLTLTLVERF